MAIFKIVISKLAMRLVMASLLGTKYQSIVALSQVGVLVRHFRGRLFISMMVT